MSSLRMLGIKVGHCTSMPILRQQIWNVSKINWARRSSSNKCTCGEEKRFTMTEVRALMEKRAGLDSSYKVEPMKREHLLQHQPKLEDLPPRSMQDSFTSAYVPLSESKEMRARYVTPLGHVRLGRLMEDMDVFAVWVCFQHLLIPDLKPDIPLPYIFVTILVDKCDFSDYLPVADKDIRLSGHVSWVGTSSMEVAVWLEQLNEGKLNKVTRAIFLIAARNATNTKSAPVNPLVPANEREKVIHSGGNRRSQRRKRQQTSSLRTVEPNDEEQKIMFDLFKQTLHKKSVELNARVLPPNGIWMSDTIATSAMVCHPEHRNSHNKIFGGFLMRSALEISSICATFYAKMRPKVEAICDIIFKEPVCVAAYLRMNATVVYTDGNYIQVMTIANIMDPVTVQQTTTNVFSYTFQANKPVPKVWPQTYDEMLWYIDGRRKYRYSMGLDGTKRGVVIE